MKIFPGALFGMDSTQGSIWRPFFCRRVSSSLAPRAFYAAPLAASSWNPPVRTVLASTSEIQLRIGIFGWFSHILYKILSWSQRLFPIQNPLPIQKVTLVQLNPIFIPLRGISQDQLILPFCLGNWLGASFLAKFYIFFSGKPPNSVGAFGSKIGHTCGL